MDSVLEQILSKANKENLQAENVLDAESKARLASLGYVSGGSIDESYEIDTRSLNKYWLGEYTILWQKPPYYQAAVQPGSQGPIVQWLDQQLVRLYGQNSVPTIHDTYNDELISQVIRFQLSKGLIPDGVAGPRTFIRINTLVGLDVPTLINNQDID